MTKAYADLSEDAKQLDRQAKEYSRQGEYVQALTCYKQLTEQEPQYANGFYNCAYMIYMRLPHTPFTEADALRYLERAILLNNTDSDFFQLKDEIYRDEIYGKS